MSLGYILLALLVLSVIGYVLGRSKAVSSAGGDGRRLHSLPGYYGWNVVLATLAPSLLVLVVWLFVQPAYINTQVASLISQETVAKSSLDLVLSDVLRVADGLDVAVESGALSQEKAQALSAGSVDVRALLGDLGVALASEVTDEILHAAQAYRDINASGEFYRAILVLAVAIAGFALAIARTHKDFRARNVVEQAIKWILIAAASIAILTTLGIILSLIFNTVEFFKIYPASEFFFGTVWSPSFGGGSELGILPLIWATLYISFIALAVAVPIGLFAAIYLSEYATPAVRAIAKPLLEVLAGIPTIVYGLFALLTVGPLLVDVLGNDGLLGVGWMQGASSVFTAGFVMGIMLIPFVSSLSDDIINAVPQAMRDGSLGLGATHSETVKQVILPAALPGIVGAILLAASRAIGETMIVVLGAGAAARLSVNPFEAMTTVTAKIVSQLTGDADFASPEALVAFALGMTLFVITLGLNIIALYIVRKYREQYD
ncbi:phosphate ABC transporter permease subunit PstC [Roseibium sediminis]|uniref:phosphate ABC transporter permease subunit PstC n=1 Tax=Roseibium sediminis TaxID=1775174 RepID=UPI00123E2188|nr:phosphate ABC transporter permease subunit PstC [Roseibium sediminis]